MNNDYIDSVPSSLWGGLPSDTEVKPAPDPLLQDVLELYTPPFKYVRGYIHDSKGLMVSDDDGAAANIIHRVRGWGRLSYMADAAKLQDKAGHMIAEALTEYWLSKTSK